MTVRAAAWLDERSQQGHLQGLLFLVHPGPSLLVTAVFVAAAALAAGAPPSPLRALQLIGVMLPIQFAIGVINDVADERSDTAAKPYKPLVRAAVDRRAAAVLGSALSLLGLLVAATVNAPTLGLATAGLGAGLLYDAGLRRTPLSWLPWWCGIVALPLAAFAAAGRLTPHLLVVLPLGLLVALSLHCANGLPDIAADRAAGQRSLPVLLGSRGSRWVSLGALAAALALAVATGGADGVAAMWPLFAAAGMAVIALLVAAFLARTRPFPVLAPAVALLAVAWLAQVRG